MQLDQVERLLIDERIDDVEHDVLDQSARPGRRSQPFVSCSMPSFRRSIFCSSAPTSRNTSCAYAPRISCPRDTIPARYNGRDERERRRPADDRLVEVEEGGFHGTIVGHRADTFVNAERRGRDASPPFVEPVDRGQPIDARPAQLSPVATFIADARKESAPAVLFANSRTVNDPLGAFVTRLPAKMRVPFSLIRTAQV